MTIHTPTVLGPTGTRIRVEYGGKPIADSRDVLLFRESPFKIAYYFPEHAVETELIDRETAKTSSRKNGKLTTWTVRDGEREALEAAFSYSEPSAEFAALRGRIGLAFESMDRWFEEDEELLGHPRDPYTRIDVRQGSQHVEVMVEGQTVIDSTRPLILTETGLPIRYYIPSSDVKWERFKPSDTRSVCPYKGTAHYWSALAGGKEYPDVIWGYPEPLQDALRIKDSVGLYHEKLEVLIEGEQRAEWPVYFAK